jgi:hypothetical protein
MPLVKNCETRGRCVFVWEGGCVVDVLCGLIPCRRQQQATCGTGCGWEAGKALPAAGGPSTINHVRICSSVKIVPVP